MSKTISEFIERVDRLEKRYKKAEYKYVDAYMMPRTLMVELRDLLKVEAPLFDQQRKHACARKKA